MFGDKLGVFLQQRKAPRTEKKTVKTPLFSQMSALLLELTWQIGLWIMSHQ